VTVTRIDRLARSTFDLFGIVKRIVDAKAQFRSLAEPRADTGTSTGPLMLAGLGGLADVEHGLSRTRTAEGRSRAKAQRAAHGTAPAFDRRAEGRSTAAAGNMPKYNWLPLSGGLQAGTASASRAILSKSCGEAYIIGAI